MIVGAVRNRAPRVSLRVYGSVGEEDVEFIVDTGYTGDLTLPLSLLQTIGAPARGQGLIALADGTGRSCPLCTVEVEWDGRRRSCQALGLDDDPLLGMTFLSDNLLTVEVTDGGEVVIESL